MAKLLDEMIESYDPYYVHKKFEAINYDFAYNLMDQIGEENYETLMLMIVKIVDDYNKD